MYFLHVLLHMHSTPSSFSVRIPSSLDSEFGAVYRCLHAVVMFSQIDVVINNAGMSYRGNATDTTMDVHMKVMMVNYFGQVALTRGLYLYTNINRCHFSTDRNILRWGSPIEPGNLVFQGYTNIRKTAWMTIV